MMKPTIKKRVKEISFLAFSAFIFTFFGMNTIHAQNQATAVLSQQVNNVDRDLVDQFETAVNAEIQEIESNPNYSAEEKLVRGKLLRSAVRNAETGLEVEDAFDVSYNELLPKVNAHAPNVNLKNILLEYKNQFS